jgi:hypothetical protein
MFVTVQVEIPSMAAWEIRNQNEAGKFIYRVKF